jgi:hypothetical protein
MRFRKLRIAFSVICGLACVLLIALWVRSYEGMDALAITSHSVLSTGRGELVMASSDQNSGTRARPGHFERAPMSEFPDVWRKNRTWNLYAIYGSILPRGRLSLVVVKLPALIVAFSVFGIAPWLRPRFSLRTLLIATTLVAVVLGAIVWLR